VFLILQLPFLFSAVVQAHKLHQCLRFGLRLCSKACYFVCDNRATPSSFGRTSALVCSLFATA
jgi:hypothetical protein